MIWVDCLYNPVVYLYSLFFRPEGEQDVSGGGGRYLFHPLHLVLSVEKLSLKVALTLSMT